MGLLRCSISQGTANAARCQSSVGDVLAAWHSSLEVLLAHSVACSTMVAWLMSRLVSEQL